jgi:hypothetical protein
VKAEPTNEGVPHRKLVFWVVAASFAVLVSAASAPSPLYSVYQSKYRFSDLTLTVIFAVYVFALMVSLLTIGRLSDYVGRCRVIQGLATGSALGAFRPYLLDLQPSDGSRLGSLVGAAAPTFGLGLGSVVSGLLLQYCPYPTRLIFAILTALLAVLALAFLTLPEIGDRIPGAMAALRPEIAVPSRARRAFVGAIPPLLATWALGGLYLSLGGSLLLGEFKQMNEGLIGALLALLFVVASVTAWLLHDVTPPTLIRLGGAALIVGAVLLLLAVAFSSVALFTVSALVSGAGFGPANLGAFRSVSQLAEEHERPALLSAVLVVSYLGFSLPALAAGLLIVQVGLRSTTYAYGGFLAVVALATLVYEYAIDRSSDVVDLAIAANMPKEADVPG